MTPAHTSRRPAVAVTLVTFRTAESVLARTVASLEETSLFRHDNTPEHNVGFATAHNRLLQHAFAKGADVCIVHNPDLVLAPGALGQLAATAMERPMALSGPLLLQADPDGRPTGLIDSLGIRWTRDGRHLDVGHGEPAIELPTAARLVAGISGACLAVPRAAYERIVGACGEFFDEDFFAYREDAELAVRASRLGVQSWLEPSARGWHVRSQRGTSRGRDPAVDRLGVRNRFLLAAKWGRLRPGWMPAVLVRDLVVLMAVCLREWSSLPGLVDAWRLRHSMRAKRRRVEAARATQPPSRA